MTLSFREPIWLGLILLAPVLAWVGLRWFGSMSRLRAWSAVIVRSALIVLIAMALSGASAVRTSDRLAVIAVVDVSGSVQRFADFGRDPDGRRIAPERAVRDWLERAAGKRGPDDLLGVVVFDGESMALASPTPPNRRAGVESDLGWRIEDLPLDVSMAEGTDIAGALRFASALFPPGVRRRLLLISDGNATKGDALRAAAGLASAAPGAGRAAQIPIDALPIAYNNVKNEIMVKFVDAPPQAARDSLITVRVGLSSTHSAAGVVHLLREGVELDINGPAPGLGRHVKLRPGEQVVPIQLRTPPQTVHRFRAIFTPDNPAMDTVAQNNSGQAFTVTPGKGQILVVRHASARADDGPGSTLARTLRSAGLEVKTVAPAALPDDLLSLQEYDLVILQNAPAEEIPRGAQEILASYVRDMGGGLVMVGGADSFGAGGWNGGAVEEVLPVEMDLPESLVIPSAAIVIVLDSSGSMGWSVLGGSRTQQEIANEAAALAIQTLDKQDLVGVIEFDNVTRVVTPLAPNVDPSATADRVRAISSGGGTNMYPALARAGEMLSKVRAQVKLVIVLTDGVSMGSPIYGQSLASKLADEGVKISTIAVGDAADTQTLQGIAQAGGGEYYRVIDPNLLPQIFIREVRVVRKPMIREGRFTPELTGAASPITAGLTAPLPALGGFVLTQPRPEATAIDDIVAPTGEPVLAHWNIGLGRSAAWTSDASRWAKNWISTPDFETLWVQLARAISRPPTSQQYEVIAEVRNGRLRLRLDAADKNGDPMDLLTVPGWVYTPDGKRVPVNLVQTGPGVYEADIAASQTGAYVTALTPRLGERRLPPVVAGAASATSPEFSRLSSNVGLLRRLVDLTGGRALDWDHPESADLFDRADLRPVRALTPIWPTLILWTIIVGLLDVGTRRIAWDRLFSRELAAQLRLHAESAVRERGDHAVATLERLRGRARRAGRTGTGDEAHPSPRPIRPQIPLHDPTDPTDPPSRRRAIREALRQQQGLRPSREPTTRPESKKQAPDSDEAGISSTSSSLFEAKRRARLRYDEELRGDQEQS